MSVSDSIENETLYAAVATGQIILDGDYMRIGVGNLEVDDEFVDSAGETRRGNVAGLWFYFRDYPDLDQYMRVHEDQVIAILEHTIRVVSIDPTSQQVVLGIVVPDEVPHVGKPAN